MKKILVFNYTIKPGGGSSGYIYNLKKALQLKRYYNVTFLSITQSNKRKENGKEIEGKIRKIIKKLSSYLNSEFFDNYFSYYLLYFRNVLKYSKAEFHLKKNLNSKYYAIMFHDPLLLHYLLKRNTWLKKYKLILMWHTGLGLNEEYNSLKTQIFPNLKKESLIIRFHKKAILTAFSKANYIIAPNPYVFEGQQGSIPKLKEIINEKIKNKKVIYIPTGIAEPKVNQKKAEALKIKLCGKTNKKIISFIGRGNFDKGYDLFIELAKKNRKNKNLLFVHAGKVYIKHEKIENLVELGFLEDPFSLLQISEVCCLLNRENYFDIALLEALSLGKLIITTKRGGHKFFANFKCGVFLSEPNISDINKILNTILNLNSKKIKELEESNRKLFKKHFNLDKFGEGYVKAFNRILKEKSTIKK